MRIRVLVAFICGVRVAGSQTPSRVACDVVAQPSDSGGGRFVSVAEGPGGRLAWTDGRPTEFLVKDASGKVRTVGRSGGGPGEFSRVGMLGWLGDTVWAADVRVPRINFYSDSGRILGVATGTALVLWVPRPDGRLVGFPMIALGSPTQPPFALVAQQPGALRRDTIKSFPNPPVERYQIPGLASMAAQPFAFSATTAFSPDGSRFCSVRPDGDEVRIECVDDRGRPVLDTSHKLSPRPLTDAVYDSVLAPYAARGRGDVMRDLIKKPRNLPPVLWMMVDNDGGIWLQRSHRSEPMTILTRLRPDGSLRDELVIPKRYRILGTNGAAFWAATADADGLETLHRCRIAR